MIQPFPTLDALVRELRVLLPAPRDTWRLVTDPVVGSINGLDRFSGAAIATNGIHVVLQNELDQVFIGHLQWFVPNADEKDSYLSDLWDATSHTPRTSGRSPKVKSLADYYAY